ncbi:MAG: peptide-methionine (S)-S-oxide reductase MsrA [Deltaproteobacteria bacterium]|nr:peptide-methionine (S)-S-oxide reductase MsrA [Deltaproteobacteria bacterium]
MHTLHSLAFALLSVAASCRNTASSTVPPATSPPATPEAHEAHTAPPTTDPAAQHNPARPAPITWTFGTAIGSPANGLAEATFAAGCFWCVESSFEGVRGVVAAVSGYTGGPELRPTYSDVSGHRTDHAEAVRVIFDPAVVSYEQLLRVFWMIHDPTTRDQSFYDRGRQYRSAIFVHSPAQRAAAVASQQALVQARRYTTEITTEIVDAPVFWPAEDDHQDYHHTNPGSYQSYRRGSGRDDYITRVWGEGSLAAAQAHSTP